MEKYNKVIDHAGEHQGINDVSIQLTVNYTTPDTGENDCKTMTVQCTMKQAEELFEKFKEEDNSNIVPIDTNYTVCEFMEYYLEYYLKKKVNIYTFYNYLEAIRNCIIPFIGEIKISDLTHQQVQQWLNNISNAQYTPKRIKNVKILLKTAYDIAVENCIVSINPVI